MPGVTRRLTSCAGECRRLTSGISESSHSTREIDRQRHRAVGGPRARRRSAGWPWAKISNGVRNRTGRQSCCSSKTGDNYDNYKSQPKCLGS